MLVHSMCLAGRALKQGGLILAGVLICAPPLAEAKTLYVNGASGNDNTTYAANGPSSPWRTIGRASWGSTNREARVGSEAAQAGDIVLVAAGTYAVAGANSRNVPAYYTQNEGTASSPITFRADGVVNLTLSSGRGSVIGSSYRNYIVWDGFTIHEASAPSVPDTGPVTLWGCTGCVLQNLDINGNGSDNNRMDNHTGIRIEQSHNIVIRGNRIQNVFNGANQNNGAGVQVYSSGAVVFEHNEIFNTGSGIFLKGGPNQGIDYFTIRYNLFHDIQGNAVAVHAGAPNRPEAPVRIYQNVMRSVGEAAVKIWIFDGTDPNNNPLNAKIVNNTIDNCRYAVWVTHNLLPNSGHVFRNNVVSNIGEWVMAYGGSTTNLIKSNFDSEHNLYYNYQTFGTVGAANRSLSQWQSTFGQDAASPASLNANPLYVNGSGYDYRLQASSPARNAGRDFLDLDGDGGTGDAITMGAYITGNEVIGLSTSGGGSPGGGGGSGPSAPTGLRFLP
jgi:nitrous oxidase accessory protein NosD